MAHMLHFLNVVELFVCLIFCQSQSKDLVNPSRWGKGKDSVNQYGGLDLLSFLKFLLSSNLGRIIFLEDIPLGARKECT